MLQALAEEGKPGARRKARPASGTAVAVDHEILVDGRMKRVKGHVNVNVHVYHNHTIYMYMYISILRSDTIRYEYRAGAGGDQISREAECREAFSTLGVLGSLRALRLGYAGLALGAAVAMSGSLLKAW